ncbi:hypothetical protein [Prauserella muralis]|uniref:Uncharacterized protein n=1 Tax=Prauserella muralis TaxID=588067 RepID=A0A2V4AYW6_9PSEU|nr:hypothetical protein [Prauserella muralis]PXY21110.1 hypothetical protein BAY60_26960 [Prauserella muralis]TWE30195.1 hypothetical protein FHX69_2892 [Prauserella muralis]
MTSTDAAHVAAWPEVQHLIDLRDGGWSFAHKYGDNGEIRQINGKYVHPSGHVDGLRVRERNDAAAVRWDGDGRVLWEHEGGVVDVVEGLLGLPNPEV